MKKRWCLGRITGQFLARMEQILHLYHLPYDPAYPVICFDERPCVLHQAVVEPLTMAPGRVERIDYEYERCGTCNLLVAFEPLAGRRLVEVSRQRTGLDYARFMQALARHYPLAKQIRIVQDNLNTHTLGSFYRYLPAQEAFALAQRFAFYYTPKKASWLNMAEIEISVLVRQCIKGARFSTMAMLDEQMQQLVKERNQARARVHWQFSAEQARQKLGRHYEQVCSKN